MTRFWLAVCSAALLAGVSIRGLVSAPLFHWTWLMGAAFLLYASYFLFKQLNWYVRARQGTSLPRDQLLVMTALHAMTYVAMADGDLTADEAHAIKAGIGQTSGDGLPDTDPVALLRPMGRTPPQGRPGFQKDIRRLSMDDREQIFTLAVLIARVSSPGQENTRELARLSKVARGLGLAPERHTALLLQHGTSTP